MSIGIVNHVKNNVDEDLLSPLITSRKINWTSIPLLRDTGTTVDVVCENYVSLESMTGEHV